MATDNDDVISTLNDLIETSRDGEEGYRTSAQDAKDPQLKQLFQEGMQSCARGASELQQLVRQLGGDPDKSGSVSGSVHRGWVNVKAAVTGRNDLAILEEVERGEDVAKARYRKALEDGDLPPEVRQIVESQYQGVMRNHDRAKALRDQYKARSNASS